jgi:Flp pilus assembly protein TadB
MRPDIIVSALLAAAGAALLVGPSSQRLRAPVNVESAGDNAGWTRFLMSVGGGVAVVFLVGGPLGSALGLAVGSLAWRFAGRLELRADKERRERIERIAPLVADLISDALAAGAAPSGALRIAADAAGSSAKEELAVFTSSLALGADPVGVWSDLSRHPQFGPIGRAFLRATESGASVTQSMRRSADDLRVADRTRREGAARAVSTKAAAPLGLCLLPAFVLIGIVPIIAGAAGMLLR